MEKTATVRHEYVAGEVYAMTGASRRHNRIAGNVYRRLADAAAGGPCRVYMETVKLRIEDVFYYPDVMVACGPEPDDPYYEDDPCLVVEVVSPSTETTDRREKLAAYKRIP
ncbi:MAG: Uma2 family endonuclease, partial [Rubrobacter sp.]|nr:Uma2 family endonuclease [Rubrobacter sp.]